MSTSPLIFLKLNYFRHNYLQIVLCSGSLLMHIWVQVEHSLLCRQIYTWISCNSSRLHAGCVWTYGDELNGALKKLILNIFNHLVSEIFGKYLHISDSIFTMFLAPDKKNDFEMFLSARGNLLVCKISSLSSIRNTIFKKICHIFDKYVIAIFSLKFVYIFSPIVTEIFRFGSKLSQKYAFTFQNFLTP